MEQSQRLRMWGCGSLWVGNIKVYCVTRVHGKVWGSGVYGAVSPVFDEHVSNESVGAGAQFAPNMQAGPRHLRLMRPGVCWAMAPFWLPFRSG
jgi:hypothetical protein